MSNLIIIGDKLLQRKFSGLARRIKNRQPMFKRIGVKLLQAVDQNFQDEGHEGTPWKLLSAATLRGRRQGTGTGGAKILQDTGTLKRSYVMDATNSLVRVGTPIIYSIVHEEGVGNVPQRKMLPSKNLALGISVDVAGNYIKESMNKEKL